MTLFYSRRQASMRRSSKNATLAGSTGPVRGSPVSTSADADGHRPPTYAARLWQRAADANRSKLSDITLAHVLSGDTVPPISLPDLEAFLAFCDISLENLHYIVWFQDYRARFDALPKSVQARSPPPERSSPSSSGPASRCDAEEYEATDAHGRVSQVPDSPSPSPLALSQTPIISAPTYSLDSAMRSMSQEQVPQLDMSALYSCVADNVHEEPPAPSSRAPDASEKCFRQFNSFSTGSQQPVMAGSLRPLPFPQQATATGNTDEQPLRAEVKNILATFIVPNAKKELLLSAAMRDRTIREAGQTTHPDVFLPIYEAMYESIESVSLPRFLSHAATNINRPRQLFWYFCAVPMFLLGVALALLFTLSPSRHLVVPPESHRAWRLFSVLCFMLASMMWYKAYRGFCPILFLRSSTQLRVWELESMADDEEAQAYCANLSPEGSEKQNGSSGLPSTANSSPTSASAPISRIAPFLEDVVEHEKDGGAHVVESSPPLSSASSTSGNSPSSTSGSGSDSQVCARTSNRFQRPPIFGPDRIVEDARIRKVHLSLIFSLMRFGLFWAAVSAAIVESVPSLHH
ncbi:hypothetical protein M0805_006566 [Coniferiporia weirii]|nr:hypothetical protein M0805_006566 [Coniferiporia weirii]